MFWLKNTFQIQIFVPDTNWWLTKSKRRLTYFKFWELILRGGVKASNALKTILLFMKSSSETKLTAPDKRSNWCNLVCGRSHCENIFQQIIFKRLDPNEICATSDCCDAAVLVSLTPDQSEARIQVTWSVWTNQRTGNALTHPAKWSRPTRAQLVTTNNLRLFR